MWHLHPMSLWKPWGVWSTLERTLCVWSGKEAIWHHGSLSICQTDLRNGVPVVLTQNHLIRLAIGTKMTLTHRWRKVENQRFSTVWSSPLMQMLGWPSPSTAKHLRSSPMGWQCKKAFTFHEAEMDEAVSVMNTKDGKWNGGKEHNQSFSHLLLIQQSLSVRLLWLHQCWRKHCARH